MVTAVITIPSAIIVEKNAERAFHPWNISAYPSSLKKVVVNDFIRNYVNHFNHKNPGRVLNNKRAYFQYPPPVVGAQSDIGQGLILVNDRCSYRASGGHWQFVR
jgi:hypothetical protein